MAKTTQPKIFKTKAGKEISYLDGGRGSIILKFLGEGELKLTTSELYNLLSKINPGILCDLSRIYQARIADILSDDSFADTRIR